MWIAKGTTTTGGHSLARRIRTQKKIPALLVPGDHVGSGAAGGAPVFVNSDGHLELAEAYDIDTLRRGWVGNAGRGCNAKLLIETLEQLHYSRNPSRAGRPTQKH